ncbi:MAG TPA: hypothetical protein VH722_04095 [Alphaproteobacteria bacterium]|jgi:hypothetical protein|nr:hypothetical protein [Alphaproteobacteria bacterium]
MMLQTRDIEYQDGALTLRGLLAAQTDKRSWAAMRSFFHEIFA